MENVNVVVPKDSSDWDKDEVSENPEETWAPARPRNTLKLNRENVAPRKLFVEEEEKKAAPPAPRRPNLKLPINRDKVTPRNLCAEFKEAASISQERRTWAPKRQPKRSSVVQMRLFEEDKLEKLKLSFAPKRPAKKSFEMPLVRRKLFDSDESEGEEEKVSQRRGSKRRSDGDAVLEQNGGEKRRCTL